MPHPRVGDGRRSKLTTEGFANELQLQLLQVLQLQLQKDFSIFYDSYAGFFSHF